MKCSKCLHPDTKVIESREAGETYAMRRRRECLKCKQRFTTYERVEKPNLLVIKKDNSRELFDRDKLANGIYKALEKRPVQARKIEEMVERIERQIYELNLSEVPSSHIGEIVMDKMLNIDDVGYVRFASVYRSFTDIESFEKVLSSLKKSRHKKV